MKYEPANILGKLKPGIIIKTMNHPYYLQRGVREPKQAYYYRVEAVSKEVVKLTRVAYGAEGWIDLFPDSMSAKDWMFHEYVEI